MKRWIAWGARPELRLYVSVAVVATALLLASAPRLLVGEAAVPGDALYQHAPFEAHRPPGWDGPRNNALFDAEFQGVALDRLVRDALQDGRVPGWNPYQGGGNVLMADGLSAPFDLPRLASQVVPAAQAPGVILWLRMLTGSLGMAALLRRGVRIGRWGALLGAAAFAASGPIMGQLELSLGGPDAWGPLVVLGALLAARRADALGLLALALPTCGLLLAGHPGTALAILCVAAAAAVWESRRPASLATALGGVALGALLSAPYLLPHVVFTTSSHQSAVRADAPSLPLVEWSFVRYWAVRPLTLLSPAALTSGPVLSGWRRLSLGSFPEATLAMGVTSTALIWTAVRASWADRRVRGAAGLAAAGVLLSSRVPVLHGLLGLPLVRVLNPNQLVQAFAIGAAVLVGLGADQVASGSPAARRHAGTAALVLAGVLTAANVVLVGAWPQLVDRLTRYADLSPGYTDDPLGLLRGARASFALLVLAQIAAMWLLVWALRRRRTFTRGMLLAPLVLEAAALWWTYNPTTPREELTPPIPELELAGELAGSNRVAGLGPRDLEPNSATLYGLRDINVYGNVLEDSSHLNDVLGYSHASFFHLDGRAATAPQALDALAVAVVLAGPGTAPLPGFELVLDGPTRVYRNASAVDRASLVGEIRVVRGLADAVDALASGEVDLRTTTILDRAPSIRPEPGPGSARLVVDEPERVVVRTQASGPRVLVLADTAAPGWSVRVDGRTAASMTANGRVRAVALPEGEHVVEWRYWPPGLTAGLWAGAAGAVVTLAIAARAWRRRSRDR